MAPQETATNGRLARAHIVNGAGDQFLAGAAFAGHKHGGVQIGYAVDHLIDRCMCRLEPISVARLPGSSMPMLHGLKLRLSSEFS
jgi:hypothetical protein